MTTLPTGPSRIRTGEPRRFGGFTLIELILVMAMLMIVFGVAFPSLRGFFQGRNLDAEARRFLSLTRYGQSRAVSEGVPMILWIDARQRIYGLQTAIGYSDWDSNALRFPLHESLEVEISAPAPLTASGQSSGTTRTLAAPVLGVGNVPVIRFQPDGFIGETSPESILIRQRDDDAVWIVQNTNRLNYEIHVQPPPHVGR